MVLRGAARTRARLAEPSGLARLPTGPVHPPPQRFHARTQAAPSLIFVEHAPVATQTTGVSPTRIFELLVRAGYRVFDGEQEWRPPAWSKGGHLRAEYDCSGCVWMTTALDVVWISKLLKTIQHDFGTEQM